MSSVEGKLNGSPIREPQEGDRIVVLLDRFDPPTMSHVHAAEALFQKTNSIILICPLSGDNDENTRAMSSIFAFSLCATKTSVGMCSVALDRGMKDPKDVLEWLRARKKGVVFVPACIWPTELRLNERFLQVIFGQGETSEFADAVVVGRYLPVPEKIQDRIRAGSDESRNIPEPVWNYIQKKRLYRGQP